MSKVSEKKLLVKETWLLTYRLTFGYRVDLETESVYNSSSLLLVKKIACKVQGRFWWTNTMDWVRGETGSINTMGFAAVSAYIAAVFCGLLWLHRDLFLPYLAQNSPGAPWNVLGML